MRDGLDPVRSDRDSKYVLWGREMGRFRILRERWGWRIVREFSPGPGKDVAYLECLKLTLVGL